VNEIDKKYNTVSEVLPGFSFFWHEEINSREYDCSAASFFGVLLTYRKPVSTILVVVSEAEKPSF
jgi:hypothetical protein